jgi:hypothetical protein
MVCKSEMAHLFIKKQLNVGSTENPVVCSYVTTSNQFFVEIIFKEQSFCFTYQ